MDRHVGVGVIGMGWMGRVHAAAFRRVHAEQVGVARAAEDWRAVLEDPDVDAARDGGTINAVGLRTQQTYLGTHEGVETS